jgi:hypothetical protein
MTIAQQTTIQAYQLKKGGTPARLAILKMIAADSVNNRNPHTRLQPGDWRGARHYTMGSYSAAYSHEPSQGFNGKTPVWYSHGGEYFRNERDAGDVLRHTTRDRVGAWHTDVDGRETAIGFVASLPHGRFIAGYRWTSNDERVYFPDIFDDETDAAHMSDEHARVFAEMTREDSEKANHAARIGDDIEDALIRLRECMALRHKACMQYVRDEISTLCDSIRQKREELRTDYADYI